MACPVRGRYGTARNDAHRWPSNASSDGMARPASAGRRPGRSRRGTSCESPNEVMACPRPPYVRWDGKGRRSGRDRTETVAMRRGVGRALDGSRRTCRRCALLSRRAPSASRVPAVLRAEHGRRGGRVGRRLEAVPRARGHAALPRRPDRPRRRRAVAQRRRKDRTGALEAPGRRRPAGRGVDGVAPRRSPRRTSSASARNRYCASSARSAPRSEPAADQDAELTCSQKLLSVVAPLFICAGIGFVWGRLRQAVRRRDDDRARAPSRGSLPGLLDADEGSRSRPPPSARWPAPTRSRCCCSWRWRRRSPGWLRLEARAFIPALTFRNSGNLGLPVCLFAFGEAGLAYGIGCFVIAALSGLTVGARDLRRQHGLRGPVPQPDRLRDRDLAGLHDRRDRAAGPGSPTRSRSSPGWRSR